MQPQQQHTGAISLVQTVYEYRQSDGSPVYRLARVIERPYSFAYHGFPIEQLKHACVHLFNHLYTARCNEAALRIAFVTPTTVYVCAPSSHARRLDVIRCEETTHWDRTCESGGTVYRASGEPEEMAAFSMFCLVYDYIRMPSLRYILLGITTLPCVPMGMPEEWRADTLQNWLQYWYEDRLGECTRHARLVLRDDERQCRVVFVCDNPHERRSEKVIISAQ